MKAIDNVASAIKKFKSFLITSHVNPEGDALGSQLAMADLLRSLGKDFIIYNSDEIPPHYQFLPQANLIKNKINLRSKKIDAAIVMDCPNLKRVGRVKDAVNKAKYVINIDHHVSNENFGDINWVEKNVSSVGEMIYRLYKRINYKLTKEAALYLYISILTDTGSFNYSNTSSATHEIVSELLGYGLAPYDISKSIYENKTLGDIKLLGKALSNLEITEDGKVAYISVPQRYFKETKTTSFACENFVNYARSIKGVDVAVFFREDMVEKNLFHISFRATKRIDVNKIASHFGGGGHKSASGCTIKGPLKEVKEKVLKRIKDEL